MVAAANIEDGEELFTLPDAMTSLKSRKATGPSIVVSDTRERRAYLNLTQAPELMSTACSLTPLSTSTTHSSCASCMSVQLASWRIKSSSHTVLHRYLQGSASSWSIYFQFLQNIAITTPYFWPQKVRCLFGVLLCLSAASVDACTCLCR